MKRHLHLAGKSVYYLLGAKLLLLALLMMGIARFMPWLESHPQQVSAWLSKKAGRPVRFDNLQAQWTRSGPLLKLKNMRVGPVGNPLRVGDAELLVSQYSGWWPGRRLTELRIRGVAITLERSDAGEWRVHGLPGQSTGGDPFSTLERLGELQVVDGKLRVLAPSLGLNLYSPHVDVRTQVNGDVVRVGMRAWLENAKLPVDAVMRFDRKQGAGRVYVGGKSLDLSGQSSALKFAGVAIVEGKGSGQAWLTMKNNRVAAVQSNVDFQAIRLQSTALEETPRSIRIDRLTGRTFFTRGADKWSLQIPELAIQSQGQQQQLKGLEVNSSDSMSVAVDRINLRLVSSFADLTDRMPAKFRQWLAQAAPAGTLDNVVMRRFANGRVQLDADAVALGVNPVASTPGIRGVSGRITADEAGMRIDLAPSSEWTFDWPAGFGVPHQFNPQGTVVVWREGPGIHVGTSGLSLKGPDASFDARGGLFWEGDGSHPRIDIAVELTAPAQVTKARGFWVHNVMSKPAINWLNSALVAGTVERGQVLVSGDLDEWPFDQQNGLFEVLADVRNFRMKFQPDWPEVVGNHAALQFKGKGMAISADGSISGIKLAKAAADIENLGKPDLLIHGEGAGDASQFLALIRSSPLQKEFGEHTDPIIATGPASARVDLKLPLHHDEAKFEVNGLVSLNGVEATHKTYELQFSQIKGVGEFNRGGFKAPDLAVIHEGQAGKLSLRVGSGTQDARNMFEGGLMVNASARSLLARVPDLAWLGNRVEGRSDWTVGVALPRGASAQTVNALELRSNLVGTAMNLPAPFKKSSGTSLPTTVRIPLPMDGPGEIQVSMGRLANVRARRHSTNTGVAVMLGGAPAGLPPARGVTINGAVPAMDALAWMAVMDSGNAGAPSLTVNSLDVRADRLMLGDTAMPGARLRMTPTRDGKQIDVTGSAMQGTIHVGSARNAPIIGRLDRLRIAMPKTSGAPSKSPDAAAGLLSDPRKLPPLDLSIRSLWVDKAELTAVRLKTSQVPAGVSIDRFSATAPQTQMEATGSWLGDATASRTALKLTVDTRNLGKLVDALGAVGQVSKGRGAITADVAWPASPMDLRTAKLSGKIHVDMREGSLVKVEPGVGRVIGLFSVARLPRRLTLDFSDFFSQGFAFDTVSGDIRFDAGFAKTDHFSIKGPAADIDIRGSANLESQTFDQTIDVYPKAGNMLTVAGAVAGGPIGAAIGAVAGQILKKPLGQMAAKTYHVTGPWSDPHVESVDKNGKKK